MEAHCNKNAACQDEGWDNGSDFCECCPVEDGTRVVRRGGEPGAGCLFLVVIGRLGAPWRPSHHDPCHTSGKFTWCENEGLVRGVDSCWGKS